MKPITSSFAAAGRMPPAAIEAAAAPRITLRRVTFMVERPLLCTVLPPFVGAQREVMKQTACQWTGPSRCQKLAAKVAGGPSVPVAWALHGIGAQMVGMRCRDVTEVSMDCCPVPL